MTEEELEIFTPPNPKAYKRFKQIRRKKRLRSLFHTFQKIWQRISSIILWICAVGGFLLSLFQFMQNQN